MLANGWLSGSLVWLGRKTIVPPDPGLAFGFQIFWVHESSKSLPSKNSAMLAERVRFCAHKLNALRHEVLHERLDLFGDQQRS